LLNPFSTVVGFGHIGNYTAVLMMSDVDEGYFDEDRYGGYYIGLSWPAQSTPMEYFLFPSPWHIEIDNDVSGDLEIPTATAITVTQVSTGKKDVCTFANKKLNSDDNKVLVFRPENLDFDHLGKRIVKITNLGYGRADIEYPVTFFSLANTSKPKTVAKAPTKITGLKLVPGKKGTRKITVRWKKKGGATGYQIKYATDKKFKKSVKTENIKKAKTIKTTVKKLKKGKYYYVKIRADKKTGSKTLYGPYCKAQRVKVK
jgi:hypothetical protein